MSFELLQNGLIVFSVLALFASAISSYFAESYSLQHEACEHCNSEVLCVSSNTVYPPEVNGTYVSESNGNLDLPDEANPVVQLRRSPRNRRRTSWPNQRHVTLPSAYDVLGSSPRSGPITG